MKSILICICTYHRNTKLIRCLKSIELLSLKKKDLKVLIVDNSINFSSEKIIKRYKKKFSFEIILKNEKKRGIVNARNACLRYAKNINPFYISFIDDDCTLEKFWLVNASDIFRKYNFDIITGPQKYVESVKSLKKKTNYTKFFEKKYKEKITKVSWAATNNVIFKFNILKTNNLKFDHKLNKFGMGEDQLFFSLLKKQGYKICWSDNVKVFENIHEHRLNLQWLKKRSFRLGVLGFYIDQKVYGNFLGLVSNYSKSLLYVLLTIFSFFFLFSKNYKVLTQNYFYRFIGKLVGPFIFSKIDFLQK